MLSFYLLLIDSVENKNKFIELYNKYNKLMFYVAKQVLHNSEDAEDAVSEAYLRIINNIDKISIDNCPETKKFIVIIVRNISIDIYRKNKKDQEKDEMIKDKMSYDNMYDDSLEDNVLSKCNVNKIAEAINKLPVIYSNVLYLKFAKEYSNKEICEILDVSSSTLDKRLQRGKILLKQLLIKENILNGEN